MSRNRISLRMIVILIMLFIFVCINACAEIRLGTIPPPPASTKIRVFVMPVTGNAADDPRGPWVWPTPHDQFKMSTVRNISKFMTDIGVYEIASDEDVGAVIGAQEVAGWQWFENDLALLKRVGKLLHADYAMIYERRFSGSNYVPRMVLVNLESGKQYESSGFLARPLIKDRETSHEAAYNLGRTCYRKIFYDAKGDILATAVRKGGILPTEDVKKLPAKKKELAVKEPSPQIILADKPKDVAKISSPPPPALPVVDKRQDFAKRLEEESQTETPAIDKNKLVVHDFDTIDRLNVVSLILTEALREELFIMGRFRLVNREDMMQVLQEMKLQQSGLVDEKQVLQLGKWLAANEAVTGRLSVLGSTYVLQAKRTDIQTMGTLGLGSLRCAAGHEDELLSGMPDLARRLVGLYTTPDKKK